MKQLTTILFPLLLLAQLTNAQPTPISNKFQLSNNSKPWVFWYWMQAAVSKAGITADLEAMKQNGIAGAYLMPIKGAATPPLMEPPVVQLSPLFWEMVKFAMQEADRLGLQMGMHFSDGFALGGGPWITPELSMQKLVFTETNVAGGKLFNDVLAKPESYKGYLKNVAVLAFPTPALSHQSSLNMVPVVTSSKGTIAQFLATADSKEAFRSDDSCWIQYAFAQPFVCRSIKIRTNGNNFQAQRLLLQSSDGGSNFQTVQRLVPPRHGWQDTDADFTYSIVPVTAKYFRFVYDKTGTEPGSEDIDAAKWKPSLKLVGIELTGKPLINQYEGKSARVWRVSSRITSRQVADSLCIPLNSILDISDKMDIAGHLVWQAPAGNWTILRIGSTSTGHTNATGGGGIGLECDKFNTEAIKLQFNSWFGEAIKQIGPGLSNKVLKAFHVDSWECGSQNWSPVFRSEFKKRRGYDLLKYLPAMAGLPVATADISENFLHDIRQTIVELINDKFYTTLKELSHQKGCAFTAESIAPTMVSDGLLHYNQSDVPMGEFWLNSPTHDKPNDMLDAISGAHIYGKPIIQAEAFTTIRMDWCEHPGMMKTLQDRNYAMGINKLVYHVFAHNPWPERKPGMTLDGIGLYFQRNQTWWKAGKAWVDYAERCQRMLQRGNPVVDIAVFTGEEIPRRSVLPDRLIAAMPGIFGEERVVAEKNRLANVGEPLAEKPDGVRSSANAYKAEDWVNPLRGYQYDCINPDALLRLATVKDGRIVLPGGASYGLLVIPGAHPMNPDGNRMSLPVARKLLELVNAGAKILMVEKPLQGFGVVNSIIENDSLSEIMEILWGEVQQKTGVRNVGKGFVALGPWNKLSFEAIGVEKDLLIKELSHQNAENIAWTHRKNGDEDVYFISNQKDSTRVIFLSFRADSNTIKGCTMEFFSPVTKETVTSTENDLGIIPGENYIMQSTEIGANESMFVTIRKRKHKPSSNKFRPSFKPDIVDNISKNWIVQFDKNYGGPSSPITFPSLTDWSKNSDSSIAYYSGTAVYNNSFNWNRKANQQVWLSLGKVANIAEVKVNGIDCGVAWTYPYTVEISKALKQGMNQLSISVSNTWANRLIGDNRLSADKRITNTTAPFRLQGKPLLEAGLIGPVTINSYK
ncbi:MAG: glycosyl hydrolase [Bacteroidota bacterium]